MTRLVEQVNKQTTSVDYETEGVKKIRVSDNLSALDVVGMDGDNQVRTKLKKATIGTNVIELAPSCFAGCEALIEVNMTSATVNLDDCAFMGCTSLQRVGCLGDDAYQLENIGNSCFMGCESLVSVNVNVKGTNRYTHIGEYAFADCLSLHIANFTGRSFIASHMFAGCESLTAVNLPANTSYVYPYGFADIPSIESIRIPRGVWFINDYTFQNCPQLTGVDIQDGEGDDAAVINQIGDFVFDGSSNVKDVYLPKSITSFAQIGPQFLAGSSVSAVHFAGVGDEYFKTSTVRTYDKYKLGKWIVSDSGSNKKTKPVDIVKYAVKYKIPFVVVMSKGKSDANCKRLEDYVLSKYKLNPDWLYLKVYDSTYSGSKTSNGQFTKLAKQLNSYCMIMGKNQDGSAHACSYTNHLGTASSSKYPHVMAYWPGYSVTGTAPTSAVYDKKTKQTTYTGYKQFTAHGEIKFNNAGSAFLVKSGSSYDKDKSAERFKKWLDNMFSSYVAQTKDEISISEDSTMSLFGLNLKRPLSSDWLSCAYYSATGKMVAVLPSGRIEYNVSIPVDRETVTNFKYGTWYYNARELKDFADRHNIPVFIERSSAGCDPCRYFKQWVYDNVDFQKWVRGMKCLFCRIEIDSGESWTDPTAFPQPYAVDQWVGNPSMSLPHLSWYWKKADGEVFQETVSYHFNPGQSDPPYSMEQIMQMTEDKFAEYFPLSDAVYDPPEIIEIANPAFGTVQYRYYDNSRLDGDITSQALSADLTAYNYNYLTTDYYQLISSQMSNLITTDYTADDVKADAMAKAKAAYKGGPYRLYDQDGIYFPCDVKKELSCKQGLFAISSEVSSGAEQTFSKICRDTAVNLKDGTYQFYIYDGATAYQYDSDSVIFRVDGGKVTYVYSGQLNVDSSSKAAVSFQPGRWYTYTAEDGVDEAQSFIDECNANGSVYDGVIVQCYGSDNISILDQPEFKKYMESSKTYFGKFTATAVTDWTNGSNALTRFQAFAESVPGKWLDAATTDKTAIKAAWTMPCVYVYAKCMNCGQTEDSIPIKHSVYELSKYSKASDLVADIKKALKTE